MIVEISNRGEDDASIICEITENEYNFLSDIFNKLNASRQSYAPYLYIEKA